MTLLNIIFAGSGEFGLPTLKHLRQLGHRVELVISQPDRPAGRGRKDTPTPIAQYALEQNLPLLRTPDINSAALPPADVMVVIAFGQKISPQVTDHARLRSINLHASLLPKYRGAAPINWAMLRGESVTGNSVIRLAPKMDAGAVLGQSQLAIGETETIGELHDRLAIDGAPLVASVLEQLANGTAIEQQQNHSLATIAPKLSRQDAVLPWSELDALMAARRINGLSPWPGCRVRILDAEGKETAKVTLIRAKAIPGSASANPGIINSSGAVACKEGAIEVFDLQPEGRAVMSMAAYRNGRPWISGLRLETVV